MVVFPNFIQTDEILESLVLMYAGLKHIPDNAFLKISTLNLDLQGNNFQGRIHERAFSGVSRFIQGVNLAWSNITSLHSKTFRSMIELQNLTVAENKLKSLPSTLFQDLRNLARLSIAGNPIRLVHILCKSVNETLSWLEASKLKFKMKVV